MVGQTVGLIVDAGAAVVVVVSLEVSFQVAATASHGLAVSR